MSSMTTDALMPAYASLQVEVYLAAPAALDSHTAGRTAQFLCPEWTPQRHMDYGIAQHAIALGLQPGADQDACTAAAFMHCAAGGLTLTPVKVPALSKALKPKVPSTLPKIKEAKAAHTAMLHGSLELAQAHHGLVQHHMAQAKAALQAGNHALAKQHMGHVNTHMAGMKAAGQMHKEAQAVQFVPQVKKAAKPLGAAFAHARKVAAKTGGGKAKQRAVAQRYLTANGHKKMGKGAERRDMGKAMHPRALRPIHSRKPTQIGTTRSGKKIFDVYAHPAHASFTAADHRDMIAAAAAAHKPKTPKI